ncbi:MAG: YibE/F family protein [Nocardioidaceae bacterium]|nr:YibE/F family protein [Nocardioidaceae bacterium]
MPHSHAHGDVPEPGPPRRTLAAVLAAVVAVLAVATAWGVFTLWPDRDDVASTANPYSGQGVSIVTGTLTDVQDLDCGDGSVGPDGLPAVQGACGELVADLDDGGEAMMRVAPAIYSQGFSVGDDVRILSLRPPGTTETTYEFLDFQRGVPLTALSVAFAVLVVVVARWRGLFALLGVAVTLFALVRFILPALLAGENPLLVAVVGSTGIMIVVLYLAHGISIRTTSALFGTVVGLAITAVLGVGATSWAHLTGLGNEDDQTLLAVAGQIDLSGVVAASMVVAGLGVLNDVTVTQASAVWELRSAQPDLSPGRVFASAMRIGRDHIASSVYTLVFAYAGSAMTVLLLIVAYQRSLLEMAGTEEIGAEIARTMVGAIGLVLAVPITTAFAVLLAPRGTGDVRTTDDDLEPVVGP